MVSRTPSSEVHQEAPSRRTTGKGEAAQEHFGLAARASAANSLQHAAIHATTGRARRLDAFDVPIGTTQSALWQLNRVQQVEEDQATTFPLMSTPTGWRTPQPADWTASAYFMATTEAAISCSTRRLEGSTGWLRLGAWVSRRPTGISLPRRISSAISRRMARNILVSGLVPLAQFYENYERLSGAGRVPPTPLPAASSAPPAGMTLASSAGGAPRQIVMGRTTALSKAVCSLADELADPRRTADDRSNRERTAGLHGLMFATVGPCMEHAGDTLASRSRADDEVPELRIETCEPDRRPSPIRAQVVLGDGQRHRRVHQPT